MIKEVVVVEGRDDISAVKKALDVEVIATGGFGISDELIERIKLANERRGVIIFTDPDFAGEKIRKKIASKVKDCKHAFLPKDKAIKGDNIGIENAKSRDIISALKKARVESVNKRYEFNTADLFRNNLLSNYNASTRREELGRILGIGYCNSKQFIKRLNNYGITRDEFNRAVRRMDNNNE